MNKVVEKKYLLAFVLVTCCFALWGFANDITNPMVKAFSKIFRMSVTDGALDSWPFMAAIFVWPCPQLYSCASFHSRLVC